MGLMYIFPVTDQNEDDRVLVENSRITLKTYGLPMVFWGYLAAALSVICIMWLSSRAVIAKMFTYEDPSLLLIAHVVQWSLYLSPIFLLGFFFYEKILTKKGHELTIIHRIFFIPVMKKTYHLNAGDALSVKHFMDSPNMAKLRNQQGLGDPEALRHFENRGYFELKVTTDKNAEVSIDRHSRKADLLKLKDLLSKY
jgi:hypothetical protein